MCCLPILNVLSHKSRFTFFTNKILHFSAFLSLFMESSPTQYIWCIQLLWQFGSNLAPNLLPLYLNHVLRTRQLVTLTHTILTPLLFPCPCPHSLILSPCHCCAGAQNKTRVGNMSRILIRYFPECRPSMAMADKPSR